jgi:hypothetical protein
VSRTRLAALLADQPACIVAMEACATSHHPIALCSCWHGAFLGYADYQHRPKKSIPEVPCRPAHNRS